MRARGSYRGAHSFSFVRTEVVENDDVARAERGNEELLDIGAKTLAVDRTVEHARRFNAVVAQSGEESRCVPMTMRDFIDQTLAARRPSVEARHVGFDPGFVDEDEAGGIDAPLIGAPAGAMPAYVRAILLAGDEGFFL